MFRMRITFTWCFLILGSCLSLWSKCTDAFLERQPTYAPAYAGLALSYATMGSWENGTLSPRETMPKAKAAALKALELDDTLT